MVKVDKLRNTGQWSEARFTSFVKSALRGAKWPVKYLAIKNAFIENGINPKTGRKCKLHRCNECKELFPQNQIQADHINPIVSKEGFSDWNLFINNLYCELEGFNAICRDCHKIKTKKENEERRIYKKQLLNQTLKV